MIALVDCNNFYVACERVFNPKLNYYPVVVLSNNDGCIISRSEEAKKIGIPMGAPLFKYKELCKKENVKVFSSNFTLYGDMSNRIMSILIAESEKTEIYSIDEAFIEVKDVEPEKFCINLRDKILKYTGIYTSIGYGPTKVLAKVASYFAKKHSETGVFVINDNNREDFLSKFPIEEIWGIGRKLSLRLKKYNINTALDLINTDNRLVRDLHNVVLEKICLELKGINCFEIEDVDEPKKSISSTRSFAKQLTELEDLEQRIANFVAKASVKLREQKSLAGAMYVFAQTNKHKGNFKYFSQAINLSIPTDDTRELIKIAKTVLKKIFVKGLSYKRAGIVLFELTQKNKLQLNLFNNTQVNNTLMEIMDKINKEHGKEILSFASQKLKKTQEVLTNRSYKSPDYTSNWNDLPKVK